MSDDIPSLLVVCTANQCRSPLGCELLRAAFAQRGVDALVRSAGTRAVRGFPATAPTCDAARVFGVDLSEHRSAPLDAAAVRQADLVIGMERAHVREAVAFDPHAWPRTFTLKELVRRGSRVGARRSSEPFNAWLARVHEGRRTIDLMGESPDDDVADPTVSVLVDHGMVARELDSLVTSLVELIWPPGAGRV